jgi:dienelactone hydrolase
MLPRQARLIHAPRAENPAADAKRSRLLGVVDPGVYARLIPQGQSSRQPDSHPTTRRTFLTRTAALLAGLGGSRLQADEPSPPPTILERLDREAKEAALTLRFQGKTAEECHKWQQEFGAVLRRLLGPHKPPEKWKTVVRGAADCGDHRREELVLLADGCPALPLYLLLPRPRAGTRRPGVLALHGHGSHGHHPVAGRDDLPGVADAIASANYDYGRQLARRGYAVACPCFTPFGVRLGDREAFGKSDPCADTFLRLQMLGKLLIAENLRDARWALEVLGRHEEVDAGRLGCVGLSYGGRMAMLTAAVEQRIKVAVVSGALNLLQQRVRKPYSCGAQVIPGLLNWGDTPEIASLIAPRHCLWEVGSRDGLIPPQEADEAIGRMRRAYKALGAQDRLQVNRFEGGHVWNGKAAYPLLDKVLG